MVIDSKPLLQFMSKRHRVYLNRKQGKPWPWTDDPILQQYKFTNVFRELDRVTRWVRIAWREPYADHPNLWFAMALARQINWPDTLAAIGFPENYTPEYQDNALAVMRAMKARGEKVYTGAYMLRCDIQDATTPDKPAYTFGKVLTPLWLRTDYVVSGHPLEMGGASFFAWLQTLDPIHRRAEDVCKWFMQHHGWGGFLSYEVVTDLMETHYLRDCCDRDTWAFAGPGAVRGLNRLLGYDVKAPMTQRDALPYMRVVLGQLRAKWPKEWPLPHLREVEHSLCEFDKYERVRLGQGKPRSRYNPAKALPL